MLNPSTADAQRDDPTIRRCIRFSRDWGWGALEIVNLYALRATDPQRLRRHRDPVGPDNDAHILAAAARNGPTIGAWGAFEVDPLRPARVLAMLGDGVRCLGLTRAGHPRHPLYAPASARPIRFVAAATL